MEKRNCYWAAPGLVVLIMLSVYLANGIFPFGTNTIAWCDMNQQVVPFLMDFKDVLSGRAGMLLNMQNAGGMSFWGVFLFFVSSPFSFLVLLVQKAHIYYLVNILLIFKMGVCSLTACLFFNRKFPGMGMLQTCAVSVMYAFCGYTMFYYQNIVWLDVMYLFPLLLLGLDRLVSQRKILLYTVVFAAELTVNFYLCYMVSVFIILAFGLYLLLCVPKTERRDRVLLFAVSTLDAVLITGVVWVPSLFQYLSSARTGNLITSLHSGDFFARLDTTLPVVFCTGAAAAGAAMTAVLQKYREHKTLWVLCMTALMLVPVFVEPVNKMWHTGNYQSFPVRYGYIPVFLCLILCSAVISAINRENTDYTGGPFSAAVAAAAVAAVMLGASSLLTYNYKEITVYTRTLWGDSRSLGLLLLFSLTAALSYFILFLLYHYGKLRRVVFSVLLCVLVLTESVFYSNIYVASAKNNAQYYSPILDLAGRIQDDSLYRVKTEQKYFDVNLMGGMGYDSLSHYTSLTSKDYMYAMKKLGYSSYWMEVNSNGGTELTDAILGNKYTIRKTDDLSPSDRKIYGNGLYSITRNALSLPVGFVMRSDDIRGLASLPDTTRLNLQEYLFRSLFGKRQELFVPYQPTQFDNISFTGKSPVFISLKDENYEGTITYRIPVTGTQTLYFDCFDQISNRLYEHINSSFSITVDGKILQMEYPTQSENGLVKLGTFTNRTVVVEIGILRNVYARSFGIAGLKEDVLKTAVAGVQQASLRQSGHTVSGEAVAGGGDEYLFLPIGYNSAYSATVNGQKVPVMRIFDTFMAVKLQKGRNTVSISCVPEGFRDGMMLSVFGLLCFWCFSRRLKRTRGRLSVFWENFMCGAFTLLFLFTCVMIYLFPLFVFFHGK